MSTRIQLSDLVAVALGLVAAALVDGLLAATGAGRFAGLPLGLLAAPLLGLLASGRIRRAVIGDAGRALLIVGAAWTLAPLVDQHLTRAIALDGVLPDTIHHLAGLGALLAGSRRVLDYDPVTQA
jgi:hypothetical protein